MIANHKGEVPFILLLLPFLAGIALGLYFSSAPYTQLLQFSLFSAAIFFILLNIAYKRLKLYQHKWVGGILINAFLLLLGWVVVINTNELNNKSHFSKKHGDFLLVRISNEPKYAGDLLRFTTITEESIINGKRNPVNGTLLITIKDNKTPHLYYGDELLIPSTYQTVDPPYNPAEFNYKKYLANQHIYYQVFLYPGQYQVTDKNKGNPIISYSLRLRQQLVKKLKRNMHDPDAIAVASTLILGYKADLGSDILQAYSKTGTIHVLSVSGAHVAIIFVLLNFSLSFLDRSRYGRLIKAIVIIILIWYYALLTGFSPAVCRAAVMITMVIIGKTYNRYINMLNILAVSAFFLLMYNPRYITDVGFQLSYLAVFGLIVLQPIVYNWFDLKNKWADKLWALCSVSIAAQVITFPLTAFYFHQFPVYFLVSNLFIVIPAAIIMYAGIGYLLIPAIPVISPLLAYILEKTILLMNKALVIIENAPYAGINKIWITVPEFLLLYGIIFSLFYFSHQRKSWLLKLSLCFILLLAISISFKRWNNLRTNNITFLSIRKHTGIIFRKGDRAIVLSDIRDTDKNYKYSVQPYLDSCQIIAVNLIAKDTSLQLPYFLKRNNLIQFGDKKVLLFDKQLQTITLPEKLTVNYLYISGRPVSDLDFINKNYKYNLLIIDNTNSNQLITRFEERAKALNINYHSMYRNKSVSVISN